MWFQFVLTVVAEIGILYLPGFFILKALRIKTLKCVLFAPLIAIATYIVMGIVYDKLNIFASWATMFCPLLVFGFILFVGSALIFKKRSNNAFEKARISRNEWLLFLLYIVCGCLIAGYYFILPLNGPGSFGQGPDNAPHLSFIQAFIDAGNYSSLNASYYHGIDNIFQDPSGNEGVGGFYPAAWHAVAALAGSLVGANAAVSANASLFVFLAIVFPLNVFYLIRTLARGNNVLIASGALICLSFGAFPWGLITFGPLYPNFAAFTFVPLVVGIFVEIFSLQCKLIKKLILGFLFVVGLFDLVFLQSNAVFTVGVLLIPFCIVVIWKKLAHLNGTVLSTRIFKAIVVILFLVVCYVLWQWVYGLPIMAGVVDYPWEPFTSLRQEVINILLLSYRNSAAQPFLAFLVVLGVVYLVYKKQHRWLIGSYAITCFMCLVAATGTGDFRSFWIGFWYTDSYRIAAMAALAAIPLAIFGAYTLYKLTILLWNHIEFRFFAKHFSRSNKSIVFSILLVAILFYPSFMVYGLGGVTTALGEFETAWFNTNNNIGNCVLDQDEQEFLGDVKRIVGDDLVINKPDDGSVFAYGGENINVLYKRTGIEAYETDSKESQIIRDSLNEYAINAEVREAVTLIDAKYVLLLDQGNDDESQDRYWFDHYYEDLWKGMDAITDTTPGFEVVLAKGDMRLYAINSIK